jgi:transposase
VYTMVEMAKANDLNTYKYLTYLLSQRPDAKMSDEQLEQLAPWSETAKANCQNVSA